MLGKLFRLGSQLALVYWAALISFGPKQITLKTSSSLCLTLSYAVSLFMVWRSYTYQLIWCLSSMPSSSRVWDKNLNMKTTFVDRNNSNAKVFQVANAIKNPENVPFKNVKPFSQYIRQKQQACIKHTIRAPLTDPLRQCTFEPDTSVPINIRNKRVGRPRVKWAEDVLCDLYVNNGFGSKQYFYKHKADACQQMLPRILARDL